MVNVTTAKRKDIGKGTVFKSKIENQLKKTIKAIRSDRGGKYISQEFKDYLKDCGIVQQLTPPYTPQHNGVSERRNRTLLNMVRSMMCLATLPLSFWDYALESAVCILKMVPTKKVDKTPYELWHGKVPNLSYLKVWGCEAHVKRHTPDKLQQRSVKFLGKGFHTSIESGRIVELVDEDILPSENTSEHHIEEESLALIVSQKEDVILVRRSIYNKKTNMDGKVHIYKARLVAKGYTQTYGVDYKETFSPVIDIRAIRIVIAIEAYYDYEICWNKRFDEEIKKIGFHQNLHLRKSQCATTSAEMKHMQNVHYALAVGSIIYDVRCTRPAVAFA
nr:retrotransposon protein, putative, Ty1-copia subclass [Tanacetum cinerariifolium]